MLSGVDIARILDRRYRAIKQKMPGVKQSYSQIEGLDQLVPELVKVVQTSSLISKSSREAILKYTGLSEKTAADEDTSSLQGLLQRLGSFEYKPGKDAEKQPEKENDSDEAAV